FVFAHNIYGQVLLRDSIVGIWICKEVKVVEAPGESIGQQEKIKQMMNAMQSSSFEFKADGFFVWHFLGKQNEFTQQLSFLSNHKWSVDVTESIIRIGDIKENLAGIEVLYKNGNTYFLMMETPLIFWVVKK